jgi:apolipoprotein N-acyltransferase/protoporphyrinogen oxidase
VNTEHTRHDRTRSDRIRVLVVGGGITGLTAAHGLARCRADDDAPVGSAFAVTLREADDRLGGKIRTTPFGGLAAVDEGADAFLARTPDAVGLAERLGLGDQLTSPTSASAAVWHHGLHRIPDGLVLGVPAELPSLARSPLLSTRGKLRAALEPILPRTSLEGDAIGPVIRARFGDEVHERLVDALVGSIYAADTDDFSLATVPQLSTLAREHRSLLVAGRRTRRRALRLAGPTPAGPIFATPTAGVGALVDALVADLAQLGVDVRTSSPVGAIARRPDASGTTYVVDDEVYDEVVVASPGRVTAPLLADVAPDAAALLSRTDHAGVILVTLSIPGADWPERLAGLSGYLVPKPVQRTVTAASFGSQKWAHWQPPGGDQVLRVSLGRDGLAVDHLDDDAVVDAVVDEVGDHLDIDVAPTATRITRWPDAFPQYRPHHLQRVATIERASRPASASPVPATTASASPRASRVRSQRSIPSYRRTRSCDDGTPCHDRVTPPRSAHRNALVATPPHRDARVAGVRGTDAGCVRRLRAPSCGGDHRGTHHVLDVDHHDHHGRTHHHRDVDDHDHHQYDDHEHHDHHHRASADAARAAARADRSARRRPLRRADHRARVDRDPGDRCGLGAVSGHPAEHPRPRSRPVARHRDARRRRQRRGRRSPHVARPGVPRRRPARGRRRDHLQHDRRAARVPGDGGPDHRAHRRLDHQPHPHADGDALRLPSAGIHPPAHRRVRRPRHLMNGTADAPTRSRTPLLDRLARPALALGGGFLVALSLPPWGFWPLAFVGVVLFEVALGAHPTWRVRLSCGAAFGFGWLAMGTGWMWFLTVPGYLVATLVFAAMHALAALVAPTGRWRVVGRPAAHTLVEVVRISWPFGGVPLATMGISQAGGPLLGVARTVGVIGLTWLVFQVGSALAGPSPVVPAMVRRNQPDRRGAPHGVVALGVVVLLVVVSAVAPSGSDTGRSLTVAAVQGGGEQGTSALDVPARLVTDRHLEATAAIGTDEGIDVVVWPENAITVRRESFEESEVGGLVAEQAARLGVPVVVGITEDFDVDDPPAGFVNAQVVMTPDGEVTSRYVKVQRVPFGEYVPLRGLLEAIGITVPQIPRDAVSGTTPAVVDLPDGTTAAVVISWEVFFARRARDGVRSGGEVILNPTNGASYTGTILQTQQVASSRLRAVETGRWVVQVSPTGFSAFVTPSGEVLDRTAVSEQAVIVDDVAMRGGHTWYTRLGDGPLVGLLLAALAVSAWFAGLGTRLRRRP